MRAALEPQRAPVVHAALLLIVCTAAQAAAGVTFSCPAECTAATTRCDTTSGCELDINLSDAAAFPTGEPRQAFADYFGHCKACTTNIADRAEQAYTVRGPSFCELVCEESRTRCLANDVCLVTYAVFKLNGGVAYAGMEQTGDSTSMALIEEATECYTTCDTNACPFADAFCDAGSTLAACSFAEGELTPACCDLVAAYCTANLDAEGCCDNKYLECGRPSYCPADPNCLDNPYVSALHDCTLQCHISTKDCSGTQDCSRALTDAHSPPDRFHLPVFNARAKAASQFSSCCLRCDGDLVKRETAVANQLCERGPACDAVVKACVASDVCLFTLRYSELGIDRNTLTSVSLSQDVLLIRDVDTCFAANPCINETALCPGPDPAGSCGCVASKEACLSDQGCFNAATQPSFMPTNASRVLFASYHADCCTNCSTQRASFLPGILDNRCSSSCSAELAACLADEVCFVSLQYLARSAEAGFLETGNATATALLEAFTGCYNGVCGTECRGPATGSCASDCASSLADCYNDPGCAASNLAVPAGASRLLFKDYVAWCCAECETDGQAVLTLVAPGLHARTCLRPCSSELLSCASVGGCAASLRLLEQRADPAFAVTGDATSDLKLAALTGCIDTACPCPYNSSNPDSPCFNEACLDNFTAAGCCATSEVYCSTHASTDPGCCDLQQTCGVADNPCEPCPFTSTSAASPCTACAGVQFSSCCSTIHEFCRTNTDPGCDSSIVATDCPCPFLLGAATNPCLSPTCDFSASFGNATDDCCGLVLTHCAQADDSAGCGIPEVARCFDQVRAVTPATCAEGPTSVMLAFDAQFDTLFPDPSVDLPLWETSLREGLSNVGVDDALIDCVQTTRGADGTVESLVLLADVATRDLVLDETLDGDVEVLFQGQTLAARDGGNQNGSRAKKSSPLPLVGGVIGGLVVVLLIIVIVKGKKRTHESLSDTEMEDWKAAQAGEHPTLANGAYEYSSAAGPDGAAAGELPRKQPRRSSGERHAELSGLVAVNEVLASKREALQFQRNVLLSGIAARIAPKEGGLPTVKGFSEVHIASFRDDVAALQGLIHSVSFSAPPSPYSAINTHSPAITSPGTDASPAPATDPDSIVVDFTELPMMVLDGAMLDVHDGYDADSPGSATSAATDASAAHSVLAQTVALKNLLNGRDKPVGNTPLTWAALSGNYQAAECLLLAGAAPDLPNALGQTALHIACLDGRQDLVRLLFAQRADAGIVDADGITPLGYACMAGDQALVALFLDQPPQWGSLPGESPLISAARGGAAGSIRQLLQDEVPEAWVNACNDFGMTALHLAAAVGDLEVVEVLVSRAADVIRPVSDDRGNTALHLATREGHAEVVQLLLSLPTLSFAPNGHGETPLHLAIREERPQLLARMLQSGRQEMIELWPQNSSKIELEKVYSFRDAVPLVDFARAEEQLDCLALLEQFQRELGLTPSMGL